MVKSSFYDRSLNRLWEQIIEMGTHVEELLKETLNSFINKDTSKLAHIYELEDIVDKMDEKIEIQALELIALQQPTQEELGKLAAFMGIIKELERIADLGLNLGEAAARLEKTGDDLKLQEEDVSKMIKLAMDMVFRSLEAYKNRDISLAEEICLMERNVDKMYIILKDEIVEYMKKDVKYVDHACELLLIVRDMERIGDHAENIAEMVNYMVTGKKIILCSLVERNNI